MIAMTTLYRYPLTLIILNLLAMSTTAQPSDPSRSSWIDLENYYKQKLESHEVAGAALLYLEGGRVAESLYYGYADLERALKPDEDVIFHWASLTKTFTAIGIMQLRDRKQLSLDDPITKYLPEVSQIHNPYGSMDEVTIRMALNHSTGLRNSTWPWGGNEEWHPFEPMEWGQLVAMFPYTKVEFEPGSRHSYSNPAIIFLGKIIEKLSGDPWEVYIDKNILKPLGMHSSYFNHTPYHLAGFRSNSYQHQNGELVARGTDFHTGITTSNGGLNASLADMAAYLNFLMGTGDSRPDLLSRESLNELWQEELFIEEEEGIRSSAALSFFLEEFNGMRVIGHTGTQWSYYSYFYIHPETGRAVISVTNTDGKHNMHRFRREAVQYLFNNFFTE